jgi:hypothetical protein
LYLRINRKINFFLKILTNSAKDSVKHNKTDVKIVLPVVLY